MTFGPLLSRVCPRCGVADYSRDYGNGDHAVGRFGVPLPSRLMLKPMRPSFPQHRRDLVEVRMRPYIFIAFSPRQPSLEAPLAKKDRDLSRDRQALSSGPRSELDFQ